LGPACTEECGTLDITGSELEVSHLLQLRVDWIHSKQIPDSDLLSDVKIYINTNLYILSDELTIW